MPDKEQDNIQDLIGDARYIPFLHRSKESYLSLSIKWISNFIFAMFQIINVPAAVILFLWFIEQLIQKVEPKFGITIPFYEVIVAVLILGLMIQYLWEKARRNMVSPTVFPIWFMNTKGVLNNLFFSAELSRKYSADLDQFVRYQADRYINTMIQDKNREVDVLYNAMEQLRQLNTFPNESFESLRRVVEYLVDVVVDPENPRHQFEVLMDRILAEITNTQSIHSAIKQGSVMLLNDKNELRIVGQFNMPNSAIRNRVIKLGEKFAGKVAEGGSVVWIEDVNTQEAINKYGFEENDNRPYFGIMGYPIQESGLDSYVPSGVIVLHFAEGFHLEDEVKTAVTKILEVYAQVIISSIKLRNYHMKLQKIYGIIAVDEVGSTLGGNGDD
jgi:hypothetical protein